MMSFHHQSEILHSIAHRNGRRNSKFIVGPMPAQEFLDDFFPTQNLQDLSQVPFFEPGCYDATLSAQYEVDAYKPFVSLQENLVDLF
jgi:hypothetical protein